MSARARRDFSSAPAITPIRMRLGGNIQLDSRWYPDKTTPIGGTTDQFILRKVRPVIEGCSTTRSRSG